MSTRLPFQPYQAALCLDSNGAPVARFCPQPGGARDTVAASASASVGDAEDAAQARSDDEALHTLVQIYRLLRGEPQQMYSTYAVPAQVRLNLPTSPCHSS